MSDLHDCKRRHDPLLSVADRCSRFVTESFRDDRFVARIRSFARRYSRRHDVPRGPCPLGDFHTEVSAMKLPITIAGVVLSLCLGISPARGQDAPTPAQDTPAPPTAAP